MVDVWCTRPEHVDTAERIAACDRLLSSEEHARRDRFVFAEDRHRYRVTRALVRTTLSRYAAVAPDAWGFRASRHGKPAVDAPATFRALRFNVSHAKAMVVCAVARRYAIGVDVEDVTRTVEIASLARRYFAPAEADDVLAAHGPARRERFFAVWTLKEAYVKARGIGLSLPLELFAFTIGPGGAVTVAFDPRLRDDPARWRFFLRPLDGRHRLALAIAVAPGEPEPEVTLREVAAAGGPAESPAPGERRGFAA